MWLRPDLARALLVVGLLLTAVALGGEEASHWIVDAEPSIESGKESSGIVATLDIDAPCVD